MTPIYTYFALNFLLIIGFNLMWYIPIRHLLKHPLWVFVAVSLIEYICTFFFVSPLIYNYPQYRLFIMIGILIVLFFIGRLFSAYEMIKSVCLFLWAGALTSFSPAFSHTVVIFFNYNGTALWITDFEAALTCIICAVSVVGVIILSRSLDPAFLTDPNVPMAVWYAFLPVPVIMFHQNVLHIAAEPASVGTDQELYSHIMMLTGNFMLFVFLTGIFCFVGVMYVKNAKVLEEKALLEIQQSQYSELTKSVERTNKNLHDFKHTINTLKTLAADSNSENIKRYLEEMDVLVPSGTNLMNYCDNLAVNSVLNHYAFLASQNNIPLNLQVDLPDSLKISDPELCSLIGNLMENAIDACSILPPEERRFSLSIVKKGDALFIVSSNTFDGVIEKTGEEYLSTKHDGFGIGIRSIRETVERYNGTVNIYSRFNEFFTDIMISL